MVGDFRMRCFDRSQNRNVCISGISLDLQFVRPTLLHSRGQENKGML